MPRTLPARDGAAAAPGILPTTPPPGSPPDIRDLSPSVVAARSQGTFCYQCKALARAPLAPTHPTTHPNLRALSCSLLHLLAHLLTLTRDSLRCMPVLACISHAGVHKRARVCTHLPDRTPTQQPRNKQRKPKSVFHDLTRRGPSLDWQSGGVCQRVKARPCICCRYRPEVYQICKPTGRQYCQCALGRARRWRADQSCAGAAAAGERL